MLFDNLWRENMSEKLETLRWLLRGASGKIYSSPKEAAEYNRIATKYYEREKLAEYIAKIYWKLILPGSTIFDSAAGTGIVTKALRAEGFEVVAFDISSHQLDFLQSNIPEVTTIISDLNTPIDCEDESVNGITQVGASRFMTVKGQEIFIKEAMRILKEDGVFIYPVFWGGIFSSKRKHGLKQKAFSFEISKFMEKCGFEILETPTLIHGIFGGTTCILIVAQKKANPKQRSFGEMLKKSINIKIL